MERYVAESSLFAEDSFFEKPAVFKNIDNFVPYIYMSFIISALLYLLYQFAERTIQQFDPSFKFHKYLEFWKWDYSKLTLLKTVGIFFAYMFSAALFELAVRWLSRGVLAPSFANLIEK
tara:strand:- start:2914 stop:3270 length:357 start_codon:yes stop_codon:yes gene_type:complete